MALWHDSEARKNWENVFNDNTLKALYHLTDRGVFDVLHGVVKDGKESKVCVAEKQDTFLAVKIYAIEASNYRNMQQYLLGDPRFEGIKKNRQSIIHNWCSKEYKNLTKAFDAGLHVPRPHAFHKNVLVMDFLGDGYTPAPRLQEVELGDPERVLDEIIGAMRILWQDEDLVHGDLSAFNVLWDEGPALIDFSQAVLKAHPRSEEFLERDVKNVLDHFQRRYSIDQEHTEMLANITGA